MEIKEKHWMEQLWSFIIFGMFLTQFMVGLLYIANVIMNLIHNHNGYDDEYNCKLSDMKLSDIVFLINFIIGSCFVMKHYFEEK